MASNDGKQTNIASNRARDLVFFEGTSGAGDFLAYNYKTDQWSRVPAYDGIGGFFSINSKIQVIGIARENGNAVGLEYEASTHVPQDAVLTTGERDINEGGRSVVTGIRPLVTGANAVSQVSSRDILNNTSTTRTNQLTYSEQFDNAAWVKSSSQVTADAILAPNNTTTADKLEADATETNLTRIQHSAHTVSSGDFCVFTVYGKYADVQYLGLQSSLPTGSSGFDIQNGALGNTSGTAPSRRGIIDLGGGWYRCFIAWTATGDSNVNILISTNADGISNYASTAGEGNHIWGAQLEVNTQPDDYPTGYIQSVATAGTSTIWETAETEPNSRTNIANLRNGGRYHKLTVRVGGGFTTIMGADVEFSPSGRA